ncbi:MAG: hypothetical protein HOH04_11245 [Rhodospirillaceae bacterium]|nr:hypothetical protein [Rhodospirillaceae bacterium]
MEKIAARSIGWEDLSDDLRCAHEYWKSLTAERIAPSWTSFDLSQCPSRLLPTTIVLDVINGGGGYQFRFFGSGLVQAHGREMTGYLVTELPHKGLGDFLRKRFNAVAASKTFDFGEVGFEDQNGFHGLQRSGRWPLSDDGERVSGIVSVIDMEISRREMEEVVGGHDSASD